MLQMRPYPERSKADGAGGGTGGTTIHLATPHKDALVCYDLSSNRQSLIPLNAETKYVPDR